MAKKITVREGHYEGEKIDHRNGKKTQVEHKVEERPVIDGYHNETIRDKYYFGRDFFTMFTDDLFDLVAENGKDKMSLREWRVFLLLCATMNTKNITVTNAEAIAETLEMTREDVSRTLTKLKKRKLVVESKWIAPQSGPGSRARIFQLAIVGEKIQQLNSNIAYNGRVKDYKKHRNDHPQLTTLDGEKLLNPHAEAQRQKLIREQAERENLFPEYYRDSFVDPDTGEVWSTDEQ